MNTVRKAILVANENKIKSIRKELVRAELVLNNSEEISELSAVRDQIWDLYVNTQQSAEDFIDILDLDNNILLKYHRKFNDLAFNEIFDMYQKFNKNIHDLLDRRLRSIETRLSEYK